MQARLKRGMTALAAAAALVAVFPGNGTAAPVKLEAYGISSDGTLMAKFRTDNPQVLDWVRNPVGLVADTSLIGLDFRVQDGKLYAVGNYGGIYTVSLEAGSECTLTKVSQLTAPLKGTFFGVDFNPAADRLRVISDTGQNLRHDLNTNTTAIDSPLSALNVTAAAYTNNDLNADTATTLFDVNTDADQIVIQSPTNNGTLVATGSLGVNAAPNAGLDVYSGLSKGKTVSNTGFGTFIPVGGAATFYTVDLLTGAATAVGKFPLSITDVAIEPNPS